MTALRVLLLATFVFPAAVRETRTPSALSAVLPIEGRWDLVVQTPRGPKPSWLEVRHSGTSTLVGQFVGESGSARPIARVTYDDGAFRFSIPPQWERGAGDLTMEGRVERDGLAGTLIQPDGTRLVFAATRAPTLRRAIQPKWAKAEPLFNGRDLAGWKAVGGENQWRVANGVLQNARGGGNLVSTRLFTDFHLHLEFRYPKDGNSGVYLRGRYEVQVADSPGPEPLIDGLGSIYGFLTPAEFANRAAGEWQSFDITLVGRTVTVVLNGRAIINHQEIPGITGGALDSAEGEPGPLMLQGDHGPVEYRNIVLSVPRS